MPQAWEIHPNITGASWRSPTALANLELREVSKPAVQPGTALVRIRAVALNPRDLMVIAHDPVYPTTAIPGLSPCSDGAGVVEAVGEGSVWKVGDRVILAQNSWVSGSDGAGFDINSALGGGEVQGALRQYAVVKDERLMRAPANSSFEEAAVIPTAGGTAMNALFFGPMKTEKGVTVLTQGTGGVSTFAIQLAAAAGATVVAISSSDDKLELARRLGAAKTINYRKQPEWDREVQRLTNNKGVDHVVEVGGAGTIEKSLNSLRQGGLVSIIGILTPSQQHDLIPAILFGAKTARGVLGMSKAMTVELVQMIEEHGIRPVIARTFEWADAKEAFETLVNQTEVGKIVIKV